jgi:hypothetical protein
MKERDYFYKEQIEEVKKNNLVLISFYTGKSELDRTAANLTLNIHKSKTLANLDKSYFIKMLETSFKNNKNFDKLEIKIIET